jgi:hypothetical protein
MNSEQQFKNFLREQFKTHPELVRKAKEIVENQNCKVLDNSTLQFIMNNNGITREQAEDLWTKSLSFNDILITKYGVHYMEKHEEIIKLTKQYQNKLVEKYKELYHSVYDATKLKMLNERNITRENMNQWLDRFQVVNGTVRRK